MSMLMSIGFWYIYEHTGFWYIHEHAYEDTPVWAYCILVYRWVRWYDFLSPCSCAYNGQITVTILKSRFSHRLDCLYSLTTPKMTGIDPCIRKANDVRRLNWVSLSWVCSHEMALIFSHISLASGSRVFRTPLLALDGKLIGMEVYIKVVQISDAGTYYCSTRNASGSDYRQFRVDVKAKTKRRSVDDL